MQINYSKTCIKQPLLITGGYLIEVNNAINYVVMSLEPVLTQVGRLIEVTTTGLTVHRSC